MVSQRRERKKWKNWIGKSLLTALKGRPGIRLSTTYGKSQPSDYYGIAAD
jgi:hypothetical protein